MKLTCTNIETCWDERRDATLGVEQARAFDAHLAECPACADKWRRESQYLAMLSCDEEPAGDAAFTQRIVHAWTAHAADPVIARLTPWLAFAAAIALAMTVWITFSNSASPPQIGASVAIAPPAPVSPQVKPNPVGTLVRDLSSQIDRSQRWRLADVEAAVDWNQIADLLDANYINEPGKPANDHPRG
ncbi:MAG: hypothetical protein GC162_15685 [Planctomycetes bacterium]|nr:hypothetical protein [Planctomycetota bacterium]